MPNGNERENNAVVLTAFFGEKYTGDFRYYDGYFSNGNERENNAVVFTAVVVGQVSVVTTDASGVFFAGDLR